MTVPPVDPRILDLARDSGPDAPSHPIEFREDGILVPGWEVQEWITSAEGGFTVTRISRGRPVVELRTDHPGALDRFLLDLHGGLWRSAHDLPTLLHSSVPEPSVPFVLDGPAHRLTLRWSEDGREFTATRLRRGQAELLALMLTHSLDDLLAAYRDPRSGPALHLPRDTGPGPRRR